MAITNGYCSLTDVKAALRITDSVDDDLLERAVEAASRRIDGECSRRFYADGSASARVYMAPNTDLLRVEDISTLTGLVVKIDENADGTYEKTLTAGTDFQIEPANALTQGRPVNTFRALDTLWPVASNGRHLVQVTADWGWPSVPDAIREATVLLTERQYKRLDSPLGVAGFGDLGAIMVRRIDPDVAALVAPFRDPVVA